MYPTLSRFKGRNVFNKDVLRTTVVLPTGSNVYTHFPTFLNHLPRPTDICDPCSYEFHLPAFVRQDKEIITTFQAPSGLEPDCVGSNQRNGSQVIFK